MLPLVYRLIYRWCSNSNPFVICFECLYDSSQCGGLSCPNCTRENQGVTSTGNIHCFLLTFIHFFHLQHMSGCHHCGQTLTIHHMLLECALLHECRDEYYTVDSLNALFETIPKTFIMEFLREAGFFYLIWCNLLNSDMSNCLENESNSETCLLV